MLSCLEIATIQDYVSGEYLEIDSVFLIIDGSILILNELNEAINSYSSGFIGLNTVFPNVKDWVSYKLVCDTKVSILSIDTERFLNIVNNYPALTEYLQQQASLLDLLLLHHEVTRKNLVSRFDLLPYLDRLKQIVFDPGVTEGKNFLLNQNFLILYYGSLIHDSGKELLPGQVYDCSTLPADGEWLSLNSSCLFSYENENLDEEKIQTNFQNQELKVINTVSFNEDNLDATNNKDRIFTPQKSKLPNFIFLHRLKSMGRNFFRFYPFYQQHSNNDCGTACWMMVGQYWGKRLDYSHLLKLTRTNLNGSSLSALLDAGESLGFSVYPGKTDLLGLEQNELPVIAHWEGNHYVVVYEINKTHAIVGDPRIGIKNLTRSQFCQSWTGYALWISPTVDLQKTENKSVSLSRFFKLLNPYKRVLTEILVASCAIQLLSVIIPIFTQILLDKVTSQSSYSTFWAMGSGLLLTIIIREFTISIRRYLYFHTGNKLDLTLVVGFMAHALKLPLRYYDSRYVGDIVARIGENRKIRKFVTGDAISTLLDMLSIFLYVGLMFYYSFKLSILALVIVPLLIVLALMSTPILVKQSREVFASLAREQSYLIEALTGIGTIKSLGVERTVRWHWESLLNKYINVNFAAQMTQERFRLVAVVGETVLSTLVLLMGVWLVMHRELSIGQLIAFNMLLAQVIEPFKRINILWYEFQEIRIAIERTNDVMDAEVEQETTSDLNRINAIGTVKFENVCFKYHPEVQKDTIANFSFSILPGQTVALVGRSGSGKSTIAKLVLGLYRPSKGRIIIDGLCQNSVQLRSLRQNIGVVDQDTFFFGGTIKENLTIAHPNATLNEIKQACDLACASEFIDDFPLLYDTKIGEGGNLLSGGQKQRLAIARALLGNPSLLILDEATSSLDTESEKIIQENLKNILATQTTLVIAHRLSTVRDADLILVLDKGCIVERGTHAELMDKQGYYYSLASQQLRIN